MGKGQTGVSLEISKKIMVDLLGILSRRFVKVESGGVKLESEVRRVIGQRDGKEGNIRRSFGEGDV